MKYDPEKHHRRSIRLRGYDYSQPGAFFITICTQNRECLFGNIVDGHMALNEYGQTNQPITQNTRNTRVATKLLRTRHP